MRVYTKKDPSPRFPGSIPTGGTFFIDIIFLFPTRNTKMTTLPTLCFIVQVKDNLKVLKS